jgi:hypothetical protein
MIKLTQRYTFLFLLALPFSLLVSCQRNNTLIPYVPVDVYININNPSYYTLQAIGGWVYYPAGSKGLIIYRRTTDEIVAYDRHSTYMPDNNCTIAVDSATYTTVVDPCSGTTWLLYDGSITNGPGAFPMHGYRSFFDGTIVHITN